jgi:hypothetical protein
MTEAIKACRNCVNFRNDPVFLETAIKGLNAMSSAWASVRGDDGLCLRHDRFTQATGICPDHAAAEGTASSE